MAGPTTVAARVARRAVGTARRAAGLRVLPPAIALFYVRARRVAARTEDAFSLLSAARPYELRQLLDLADGHDTAVELGTGTAWTAIALALADPGRRVVSYDPIVRPERERYLALVRPGVRERIDLVAAPGEAASPAPGSAGFVFVDSAHDCASTVATFGVWRPALRAGGVMAFHDFDHPDWPGVREATEALGLQGDIVGGLFVWRPPVAAS
ncbi:MAG: class I SAM-dependent methyltransferase [Actinomycetota bacterium]|nr:class I SAM-dependent methyltransferase [Actinomycetota bacterium]